MSNQPKATVEITNVNAVATEDGVLVEFEYVARAPGVDGEWGAGEKLLPWPLTTNE